MRVKILKFKLSVGNNTKAINTWAIPLIIYIAGTVNRTQAELKSMDRKTRKIVTMNYTFIHKLMLTDSTYKGN